MERSSAERELQELVKKERPVALLVDEAHGNALVCSKKGTLLLWANNQHSAAWLPIY